jgi:hypothetical protein
MSHTHIFPSADADFNGYVDTSIPYLVTSATRLSVSTGNVGIIQGLQKQWDNNWVLFTDPTQHTPVVTTTKTNLRGQIEVALRSVFGDIPQSALTDADRATLHLKAHDTHGTRKGVMDHAPKMAIDETVHLQHTLRFTDPETPTSQAMPDGQKIVLQSFTGAAGLANAAITFNNSQNVTSFLATVGFTEAQEGQTCYYRCCYESTHGEQGPWSTIQSMVIE